MYYPEYPTTTSEPRFNYKLHIAVLVFAVLVQTAAALIRIGTSYRVLELGLPVVWLGVISSAFALLPIIAAIHIGRFIDRGNDALASWIGAVLMGLSCVAIDYSRSSPWLMVLFTASLGLGYMMLMISVQILCIRSTSADAREQGFGNYMAANAIGQGMGPLMVSWIGGSATVPDTAPLFALSSILGILLIFVSFTLRPAPVSATPQSEYVKTSVAELMRIPGLPAVMMASVIAITAQDLVIIYLPLLGTERGIAAAHIGALLTVRSVFSLISRLLYARMVREIGHWTLLVSSMAFSAVAFVVMALPSPLWILFLASAVMGFGLGVATTLSITTVVHLVPLSGRATAMTLRITGNRIGQVMFPLMASGVAAATGSWGILALVALSLAGSSAGVLQASAYSQPLRRK